MSVKFLAEGPIQKGVDYYWDQRVANSKGSNAYKWAAGCTHIAWFSEDKALHEKAFLVSPGASHWYIPMWHRTHKSAHVLPQEGFRLVCPSKQAKDTILSKMNDRGDKFDREITWCLWDSGLDAVNTSDDDGSYISIYVPIRSHVMDETGELVLRAVFDLLNLFPDVQFTLEFGKSWSKSSRSLLRSLKEKHGERICTRNRLSPLTHVRRMHEHDWTWLPSTRVNTGIVAQRSLACGTPVIVYDISPFSEFITDGVNGVLVECDIYSNEVGAPVAGPRFVSVVNALASVITGEKKLHSKCKKTTTAREKQHAKQFRLFWAKEWGVV
jgi:glycosyltransferase involved in cell wall biosynthesis